jgi:hypothetical protein
MAPKLTGDAKSGTAQLAQMESDAAERADRARRAAIIRWCPQARQEPVYQRLVASIKAAVKDAPPLTPEQKSRLAGLLNSTADPAVTPR